MFFLNTPPAFYPSYAGLQTLHVVRAHLPSTPQDLHCFLPRATLGAEPLMQWLVFWEIVWLTVERKLSKAVNIGTIVNEILGVQLWLDTAAHESHRHPLPRSRNLVPYCFHASHQFHNLLGSESLLKHNQSQIVLLGQFQQQCWCEPHPSQPVPSICRQ